MAASNEEGKRPTLCDNENVVHFTSDQPSSNRDDSKGHGEINSIIQFVHFNSSRSVIVPIFVHQKKITPLNENGQLTTTTTSISTSIITITEASGEKCSTRDAGSNPKSVYICIFSKLIFKENVVPNGHVYLESEKDS